MSGKDVYYLLVLLFLLTSCREKQEPQGKPIELQVPPAAQNNVQTPDSLLYKKEADTAALTHRAILTTTAGTIVFGLFANDAPQTVTNFIELAKRNFYNNIAFHRIVKGFVIQAGDPLSRDTSKKAQWGNGGETWNAEVLADECDTNSLAMKHGYRTGIVAMANKMKAGTASSQFFICVDSLQNMPPRYAIFARVLNGMDVVQKIAKGEIDPDDGRGERPLQPVRILSITIQESTVYKQSEKQ